MSWRVLVRPEAEEDISEAAAWYDDQAEGLGSEYIDEVLQVLDELSENSFPNSRRHPRKNIR